MATKPKSLPARAWLKEYPAGVDALDLYRLATPAVAAVWQKAAAGLGALRDGAGIPVAEMVARQIQELGLSFRMTGDNEERAWPLSPMPLVIGAAQWRSIEAGLHGGTLWGVAATNALELGVDVGSLDVTLHLVSREHCALHMARRARGLPTGL